VDLCRPGVDLSALLDERDDNVEMALLLNGGVESSHADEVILEGDVVAIGVVDRPARRARVSVRFVSFKTCLLKDDWQGGRTVGAIAAAAFDSDLADGVGDGEAGVGAMAEEEADHVGVAAICCDVERAGWVREIGTSDLKVVVVKLTSQPSEQILATVLRSLRMTALRRRSWR
jgi:hypothetical protein